METFGAEVGRLMADRGMTQQQLADAAGVTQGFVSQMIRSEKPGLGADVLFRLSKVLGVECSHFAKYFETGTLPPESPTESASKPKRSGKSRPPVETDHVPIPPPVPAAEQEGKAGRPRKPKGG